jgi:hypothetical protein
MDLQAARLEDAEWIRVAQDRDMKRVRIIPYNLTGVNVSSTV